MRGRFAGAVVVASLLGLLAGCDDKKKPETPAAESGTEEDAGLPVNAGRLGAALASAATVGGPAPTANAAAGQGPPENGIFAPGAAEAALPKSTPFKIEMLGEGSEPRVSLAPKHDAKAEQKSSVILSLRMGGGQGLPALDFGLSFKADKPKKDAAPAEAPSGTAMRAKLTSVVPASMSPGGLPKELVDAFSNLKGSEIHYQLAANNAVSELSIELSKGAEQGLRPILDSLAEVIGLLTPALPDKPVGVGAMWMVTDRFVWPGAKIPVLRYRVFKIEKIEPNGAVSFSVDTRQYAEEALAKLPDGATERPTTLDGFESSGKGSLVWSPTGFAPSQGEIRQKLGAQFLPPNAPPGSTQRAVLQSELIGRFQVPGAPATP
ncbi:hypothetical protein [Chondromyces crocatus]|nr:hypothetical protein [Chondromyces crocatus]